MRSGFFGVVFNAIVWRTERRERYGTGRRLPSPGSLHKSPENREKNKKKWNQQHTRIYIKKAIHKTWKRLKGSVVSIFDQHSHKLMGWKACTLLLLVLVRRALSWSFDPFCFLFFCSGFRTEDF